MIRLTERVSLKLTEKQLEYLKARAQHETQSRGWQYYASITVSDVLRGLIDEAMKTDAAKSAAQPKRGGAKHGCGPV